MTKASRFLIEISGIDTLLAVGDRISVVNQTNLYRLGEIVSFRDGRAQAFLFGDSDGFGPGASVRLAMTTAASGRRTGVPSLHVSESWIGRVVDPFGVPLDGKELLPSTHRRALIRASPPAAATRGRLGPRIELGVRALDLFCTCREGQRLGLFAGSGVGKSSLLAMLARNTACDVAVVALVGERGREVREFIEDDLGIDGLARSVLVVATSDAPPLMRREAAHAAFAVAESFRDQGKSVLLLMDSITRYCGALREIGLASGELPATRGYPPSVFAELPRLLERAGPGGPTGGQITALLTVLVEGDDHNEPVADAVRGILDGHVVLDRQIAEAGRYPAVDVARSLSRSVPGCNTAEEHALVVRARAILKLNQDMADLVRLGGYRHGSDPAVDQALTLAPQIESMLRQTRSEQTRLPEAFARLQTIFARNEIVT